MTRIDGSLIITVLLYLTLVSCNAKKDLNCENFTIENGVLLQDEDSVVRFSNFRDFEPSLFHDSSNNLFLYDGFRYVFNYDCDRQSVSDTFIIDHKILQQPVLDNLGDNYLILSIGFEKYVIKKNDLSRYGQYTDSILRVFENEYYDTYGDFSYSGVKISDTLLTFYLQGNVKYDSINFEVNSLR